jgi:hypothetical protein
VSRIVLAIVIGLFCRGTAVNVAGQTRKIDSPEVLKQLLALPARTPRNGAIQAPVVMNIPPAEFYSRNNTPSDDAPTEDLIVYWSHWNRSDHEPTAAVKKRLLDACVSNPQILPTMIDLLPDGDSTLAKVKNIYEKSLTDEQLDQNWRDSVKRWLLFNSTYFLDELIGIAHKAKDNAKDGDVYREDALIALAGVSWTNAEPLLRGLVASGQPRSTALALSLYYKHAIDDKDLANEERYRRELQAIASNRNQPGYARKTAVESLSLSEWSGRDDWYIALFQDETLLESADDEYSSSPITTLFKSNPEKWIPVVSKLVESKDINVRSAAAACLVTVEDEEAGKKALMPLLPWLTNPAWASDSSNHRMTLIQRLRTIRIPESVPGLMAIVESDDPELGSWRAQAAESLGAYHDARAVPVLKKALVKEKDDGVRYRIVKGLISANGISEKELLDALEEYAAKLATPEGRVEVAKYRSPQEEALSATLTIGKYLAQSRETPAESLINAVIARAEELKLENPGVANGLLEITHLWGGHQVEFDIVRRIGNGAADSATIAEAIQRRVALRDNLRVELQGLASVAGAAQGIGAVLLDDPTLAQGILNSEDQPAQIALLAGARLTQMALPVELVGPFLRHKNSLLTRAAETYLLVEDSKEARDLLWQTYPNQAFITGWRETYYVGDFFQGLIKHEEKLRDEVLKENGPREILAFLRNLPDQGVVVRIYSDKATCTEYEDAARYRERTLSNAEVAAFKDILATGGYLERGPVFEWCHHVCPVSQLLAVTKEKGRRVFNHGGYLSSKEIEDQFTQLLSGDGAKVHYKLEQEIKGLEVLYAGELTVNDVAQQGNELRIFVERPETKEEADEQAETYKVDDEDEALQAQLTRRRVELNKARFSWRVFSNDKPGAVTSPPDFYSIFDETKFMLGDDNDTDWEGGYDMQTQVLSADSIIIARNYDGLWRQFAGTKPVRLGSEEASYENPVVTRDGKWVVVLKVEDEKPDSIVRLNLQTGREFRVELPAADVLTPIASLPSLGKVVVRRGKSEQAIAGTTSTGPDRAEYYLLDPATGATRLISGGNFTPLHQHGSRVLQATEKSDEFWAAIPDEKKNHTEIGRYSLKDFSFKPIMTVPQLIFDSMTMWIDAGQRQVYLVYKGQLLRLPLQTTAK